LLWWVEWLNGWVCGLLWDGWLCLLFGCLCWLWIWLFLFTVLVLVFVYYLFLLLCWFVWFGIYNVIWLGFGWICWFVWLFMVGVFCLFLICLFCFVLLWVWFDLIYCWFGVFVLVWFVFIVFGGLYCLQFGYFVWFILGCLCWVLGFGVGFVYVLFFTDLLILIYCLVFVSVFVIGGWLGVLLWWWLLFWKFVWFVCLLCFWFVIVCLVSCFVFVVYCGCVLLFGFSFILHVCVSLVICVI